MQTFFTNKTPEGEILPGLFFMVINRNRSDERTDVYGIGAVLHHMITGRPPLETGLKTLEEFGAPAGGERHLRHSAGGERFPRHYSYMAKILLRCCSVTPSMRYSSCAELEKALRDVIRLCDKAGRRANEADGIWRKFTLLVDCDLEIVRDTLQFLIAGLMPVYLRKRSSSEAKIMLYLRD